MWHRRRVTKIARTRRALFVPAAARDVSLFIAEALEDRTLLSAVTDFEDSATLVNDDSESQAAQIWLIPANTVAWFVSLHSDFQQNFQQGADAAASAESTSVGSDVVFRFTLDSNWLDQLSTTDESADSADLSSALFVIADTVSIGSSGLHFEAASNDAVEPIKITFRSSESSADPLGSLLNRFSLETPIFLKLSPPNAQLADDLLLSVGLIANAIQIVTGPATTVSTAPGDFSKPDFTSTPTDGTKVVAVTALRNETILGANRFVEPTEPDKLIDPRISGIAQEFTGICTSTLVEPEHAPTFLAISMPTTADSAEAAVALALWQTAKLVEAAGISAIVESPAVSLHLAAEPIIAAVETVLTTLDTFASAVFALFMGSGGSSSGPIAPTLQPRRVGLPILMDSQRPRWALQTGRIEELAAYSLVVAPDQHFDLREFGPASRLNADDSVIRIEFSLPPQHGQIESGAAAGLFRYSADPGFSGVDGARFQATFASGQTVAGNVTFVVPDPGTSGRPAAAIRQVDLPVNDRRVSESSPASIDESFRLSGVWLDLP